MLQGKQGYWLTCEINWLGEKDKGLSDWKSLESQVKSKDITQPGQHLDSQGKIEGGCQVEERY